MSIDVELVGRDAELALTDQLIDAARAGHGHVLVVQGEAGIGKSRFLDEVLVHARAASFRVAGAACDESEHARPFAAVTRALGIAASSEPADGGTTPEWVPGQQYRLLEVIEAAVESLAATDAVALAFDDLHWADPATLLAFRSIAKAARPLPVLLVGTVRSGHAVGELHRLVADLDREGATHIELGALDPDAVAALASAFVGSRPDEAVLASLDGAGGNPLFVTEYLRTTSAAGTPVPEGADGSVPVEFRRRVLGRVGQLPQETQDLLRLASVLGSHFSPNDLAASLQRSVISLEPAIHQAVAAGVIAERGAALGFRHDLVRAALYEHIPLTVRRELHREVGNALAASGAEATTVAHHLVLGINGADEEVAAWLRRAAAETASRSPAVAVELLERCRDALPASSPSRAAVLTDLVTAYAWSGRLGDAEALGREVLERWPDQATRRRVNGALVRALTWQGRPAEALRHAAIAPDDPLDDPDALTLAAEAAFAALLLYDMRQASELATRVVPAAEAAGNELALCQGLSVQAWAANFLGQPQRCIELARRAIDVADRSAGGHGHLANPCFFPAIALISFDRIDEATRLLQEGRRLATDRGLIWSLPLFHAFLGVAKFSAGDWDGAMAEIEAGLAIADEAGVSILVVTSAAAWLGVMQLHRDDLLGAEATIARAIDRLGDQGTHPLLNWALAELHEARGEIDEALALLQAAWDLFMARTNVSAPWVAMALVRMRVRAGHTALAEELLPIVDAHCAMVPTPSMEGQRLRCHGLVADDAELLLEAVEEYRRCPRPHELGGACEDAAHVLARHDRLAEAIPLYDEAIAAYEHVGALRDINRVRASMRTHGVRRGARQGHVRATSGWASLTPAERKVAALVEQRLSNPEIADRLFVSRHTVESHLKHIYRKLEVSSRLALAEVASQHGNDDR